ncbi:MAG: hypothetical protein M1380_09180, partial [Chloroflexi bacterium]|nr:hypothetical protein [Chloroflexota bacterium]
MDQQQELGVAFREGGEAERFPALRGRPVLVGLSVLFLLALSAAILLAGCTAQESKPSKPGSSAAPPAADAQAQKPSNAPSQPQPTAATGVQPVAAPGGATAGG